MTSAQKLARLSALARLKADRAKAELAAAREPVDRLSAEIAALRAERQARAAESPDPAGATARAAWLRQSDLRLRDLMAELARARSALEARRNAAGHEEGRRQVLEKLKTHAS